jgi:hypothetical protein
VRVSARASSGAWLFRGASTAAKKLQKTVTDGCARLCARAIRDCSKSRLASLKSVHGIGIFEFGAFEREEKEGRFLS